MKRVLAVVVLTWPVLTTGAVADQVTDQMDAARQYYEEGDVAGAITELQFAISDMRAMLSERYVETFPPPPQGWTADAASQEAGAAMMGGGTMINRSYRAESGGGAIQAQLMVDNPMIQGFAAMLSNPAMMAAQPNMSRVRVGRENAILNWDPSARRGEINMTLGGGRALLKLEGSDLDSGDLLVDLLKAWDIEGLREIAGF